MALIFDIANTTGAVHQQEFRLQGALLARNQYPSAKAGFPAARFTRAVQAALSVAQVDELERLPRPPAGLVFVGEVVVPFLRAVQEDALGELPDRWRQRLDDPFLRYATLARAMLVFLIDEQDRDAPDHSYFTVRPIFDALGELKALRGIRAEIRGDRAGAVAAYAEAAEKRPAPEPSYTFASWRLRQLGVETAPQP